MRTRNSMPFWALLLSVPMAVLSMNVGSYNNEDDQKPTDEQPPTTELKVDVQAADMTADTSNLALSDGNSDDWRGGWGRGGWGGGWGRGWGGGWGRGGWGGWGRGWGGGWGGWGGWGGDWGGWGGWGGYSLPVVYTYPVYSYGLWY